MTLWTTLQWQQQNLNAPFNSLAPGKFEWHFRYLISQIISVIDGWGISCELAFRWMPLDLTDDKSTLVQVMAWCHQATSHYLSQWWPRSLSPYGATRPQWVNSQKTPNTLPRQASYWVFFAKIREKIGHVITASHCTVKSSRLVRHDSTLHLTKLQQWFGNPLTYLRNVIVQRIKFVSARHWLNWLNSTIL